MFATRKNPETGMLETYELPEPVDLESARKELRDFIHGNIQWHDDPYSEAKPVEKEVEYEHDQYQDFLDAYTLDTY